MNAKVEAMRANLTGGDLEAVQRVFGVPPDEVLFTACRAVETLGWLEFLFNSIRVLATQDNPDLVTIGKIAGMGGYLACDTENSCAAESEMQEESFSRAKGGAA